MKAAKKMTIFNANKQTWRGSVGRWVSGSSGSRFNGGSVGHGSRRSCFKCGSVGGGSRSWVKVG
jgi:hypothetical protein